MPRLGSSRRRDSPSGLPMGSILSPCQCGSLAFPASSLGLCRHRHLPSRTWQAPRSKSPSPPCLILSRNLRSPPLARPAPPRGSAFCALRLVLCAPPPFALHGRIRSWTIRPRPGASVSRMRDPAPTPSRSLPAPPCGHAFGGSVPPDPLVPPSWFLTTSTAFSATAPRACCIPQPVMGFTVVRRVSGVTTRRSLGQALSSPRRGLGPLEGGHASTAAPCHQGRCPPGVSLLRETPPPVPRPRGRGPSTSPCRPKAAWLGILRTSPCSRSPDTPNPEGTDVSVDHRRVAVIGDGTRADAITSGISVRRVRRDRARRRTAALGSATTRWGDRSHPDGGNPPASPSLCTMSSSDDGSRPGPRTHRRGGARR